MFNLVLIWFAIIAWVMGLESDVELSLQNILLEGRIIFVQENMMSSDMKNDPGGKPKT
jgi:hypothetical protein